MSKLGNWGLAGITFGALLVLYLLSHLIPDYTIIVGQEKVEMIEWSTVALVWFVVYFAASWRVWRTVQQDEVAILLRFGKAVDEVGPGLVFAPLWIYNIQYLDRKVIQREFPADPEKVFEGDLNERTLLPPGMKPAIRITFNNSIPDKEDIVKRTFANDVRILNLNRVTIDEVRVWMKRQNINRWCDLNLNELDSLEEKAIEAGRNDLIVDFVATQGDDGLHRRLTTQVTPVVLWKIIDPIEFITKVGSVEIANQWIEDDMVSILQRILPRMSVAQAMDNIAWINAHLFRSVTKRMLNAGVQVENAYMKRIPLHHSLNEQISARAGAFYKGTAEAEITRLKGAADADVIALTGKAKADAARQLEEETLRGRAAGMKKMAEDLGVGGADVQAAEVARAVAEGGNTIVIGTDGFTQIAGIAAAMQGKKKPAAEAPKPSDGPEET